MIGEDLEGDHCGNGRYQRMAARDEDGIVHALGRGVVALGNEPEHLGTAGTAFFNVAEHFVLSRHIAGDGNDRGALLQQRDRSVFELGGMIAFRMNIGNFLLCIQ